MHMPDVAQSQITGRAPRPVSRPPAPLPPHVPLRTGTDEAAARRSLRDQIAKLERDLATVFAQAYPRRDLELSVRSPGGPRVLEVGELEELRDRLAVCLEDARGELSRRAFVEQEHVERIERMIAEPERHKWVRVSNWDLGEPGCKFWHSRPRLGLIGMLLGWWRVKISSGCP
jgi:hypothetical protein